MSCSNCSNTEQAVPAMVPLYAVEGESFRKNKTMRMMAMMFVVCLVIISIVIGLCGVMVYRSNKDCLEKVEAINQHWLDYLAEYDFSGETYEYSQDGRGLNIMGDNNGVDYNGVIDDEQKAESDGSPQNP